MTRSSGTGLGAPGGSASTSAPPRWYAITGIVVATLWISGLVLGLAYYLWALSGVG